MVVLLVPCLGEAQSRRTAQIGFLTPDFEPSELGISFKKELHDLGYVDGMNIHVEFRGAAGRLDQLDRLAGELVT